MFTMVVSSRIMKKPMHSTKSTAQGLEEPLAGVAT
jgi:hypothetical protein